MAKIEDLLMKYKEQYVELKEEKIKKEFINKNLFNYYNEQTNEKFVFGNLTMKLSTREKRVAKKELYEVLEDSGLLPLAVNLSGKALEKHFNIDKAKINYRESIRLYSGRTKLVDTDSLKDFYEGEYTGKNLEELTEEFNKNYSSIKLKESKLEETKREILTFMKDNHIESLKTSLGTFKYVESYDLDPVVILDTVKGKKEIFIREVNEQLFEIILFPEFKKATLPKEFKINNKRLSDYFASTSLESSSFIKKSEFNALKKENYKAFSFEIPVDPNEFFKSCPISLTKVQDLIDRELLDEDEVSQYIEPTGEKIEYFTVLTEASAEKMYQNYHNRLIERAGVKSDPISEDNFVNVDFDSFSF